MISSCYSPDIRLKVHKPNEYMTTLFTNHPRFSTKFGKQCSSQLASILCHRLPLGIRLSSITDTVKCHPKTHLFTVHPNLISAAS